MGVVSSILCTIEQYLNNHKCVESVANKVNQDMSLRNAGWATLIRIVLGQDLISGRHTGSTVFLPRLRYVFQLLR